ncbi:MAG: LysM peptidoglycan-binding domain-containing protein [Beutenbergiaceae bacterium]
MISGRLLLSLCLASACATAAGALATVLTGLLSTPIRTIDATVQVGVYGIGLALLLWYLATALVAAGCLLFRLAGSAWTVGESHLRTLGAPVARRLLAASIGGALAATLAITPAMATTDEPSAGQPTPTATDPASPLAEDLGWGAAPAPPAPIAPSPTAPPPTGPAPAPTPPASAPSNPAADTTPAPGSQTYTVRPGDSLWRIAADHLADPSTAQIAAAWPSWYQVNIDTIGAEPDLIHPGQVLHLPPPQPPPSAPIEPSPAQEDS